MDLNKHYYLYINKKEKLVSIFDGNKETEKHPFSKLEIGESFPIPEKNNIQSMRALAYQRGEALGRKFKVSKATRTVERVS